MLARADGANGGSHRRGRRDRRSDRARAGRYRARCGDPRSRGGVCGRLGRRGGGVSVAARLGPRDVLVHAAAAFDRASLAELDSATWRRVQAVNVESALWLCQELTPAMIERGFGRIVFITSNTVWRPPGPDFLPYVVNKATLVGIARSLAKPLGAHGITVNCVAPGSRVSRSPRQTCRMRPSKRCSCVRPVAFVDAGSPPPSWLSWPRTARRP